MRIIGFSTGALARGDYRHALEMLSDKPVTAVELSALRQDELRPLVEDLDNLDLRRFRYYVKSTEKTTTSINLHLDRFIGEVLPDPPRQAKAHLISVVGGDTQISAISAAISMGDRFMVEGPGVQPTRVCLERNAQCFKEPRNQSRGEQGHAQQTQPVLSEQEPYRPFGSRIHGRPRPGVKGV
jgi:hypothetical protein